MGMEGRGWQEAPHPALPRTPIHRGFSLQGTGRGAGAEAPDGWAKLGRQRWEEAPTAPGTGLSYHWGGVGFVTDGSQPPREGSSSPAGCGRRHSRADERKALAPQPRGQRPEDLPNSWARVVLDLRPALTHTWAP